MDMLEKSLAIAKAMLKDRTPEQFENEYLSIKNGIGPYAKEFINSYDYSTLDIKKQSSYKAIWFGSEGCFNRKTNKVFVLNTNSSLKLAAQTTLKRTVAKRINYSVNSEFYLNDIYDYPEVA